MNETNPTTGKLKKCFPLAGGFFTGILNGLFGAGGGMVAVPFLRSGGLDEKESHASSVALLMALSLVSTALYLHRGSMTIGDALPYLPGALAGSAAGALLMPKISTKWLRRIFGLLMIYGGIRMVTG